MPREPQKNPETPQTIPDSVNYDDGQPFNVEENKERLKGLESDIAQNGI